MRGIKQAETRHTTSGSTQTTLYFDKVGDKVVAINGELPTDADLARGWGQMLNGLACGIAANREKGRQEDLHLYVTIKNINHDANGVLMISPVLVELKDLTGRVIERKPAYTSPQTKIESDGCPTYMSQGAPLAGRAQPQPGYELGEQYNRLAPGRYSITITYCVSGLREKLVSNTIPLEVEGPRIVAVANTATAQPKHTNREGTFVPAIVQPEMLDPRPPDRTVVCMLTLTRGLFFINFENVPYCTETDLEQA